MARYGKVSWDDQFIEVIVAADDATFNTRAAAAVNKKPYVLPLVETDAPTFDPTTHYLSQSFAVGAEAVTLSWVKSALSTEAAATAKADKKMRDLRNTDISITRGIDDIVAALVLAAPAVAAHLPEVLLDKVNARAEIREG